jgi:hypothetical protein
MSLSSGGYTMNKHGWHLVSSFESLTGAAAFRIATDRVSRLRLPVARCVNGDGDQALLVSFNDFSGAGPPEVVCHLWSSYRVPITEADWLVIVSRATDIEALLAVVEHEGPAHVRPQWLAVPLPEEQEAQALTAAPIAGRLELGSGADSPHTLELHALPQPSVAQQLRQASPAQKIPEGPDNLQRRAAWFGRKSGPVK